VGSPAYESAIERDEPFGSIELWFCADHKPNGLEEDEQAVQVVQDLWFPDDRTRADEAGRPVRPPGPPLRTQERFATQLLEEVRKVREPQERVRAKPPPPVTLPRYLLRPIEENGPVWEVYAIETGKTVDRSTDVDALLALAKELNARDKADGAT
jgi:hypothetical protein